MRRKGLGSRPKPHQMAIKLGGRIQYISPFLTPVTTAKCLAAASISQDFRAASLKNALDDAAKL